MVKRVGSKNKEKKKGGFVYKKRDPETVKARAERKGGGFDSPFQQRYDVWRPKSGENTIRILPPTFPDAEHHGMDIWVHGSVGPENSSYLCLQKHGKGSCPICKSVKELKDAGEGEEAKQLEAKSRLLVWMIDRNGDDDKPKLFSMSWTQDKDMMAVCINKRKGGVLIIDDPNEGFDMTFRKDGEGLKTRYSAYMPDREATPIFEDEDKQNEVLEYINENPLHKVLRFYDASYLEKLLSGEVKDRDEDLDDDEEEEKSVKGKNKGKKKPSKEELEDEDEEDTDIDVDDEDDDEDEDERPAKKKGKSSKKSSRDEEDDEDEDDEEEDEDEDDEEDEPPAKKKGKVASKKRPADDDDDDEEEDEDEDEDDEPPAKKKGKVASKKKPADDEDEDEDDEDEDDEDEDAEDEDEEPVKKKGSKKAPPAKGKKKPVDDDEDEEEDDEDEDEDEEEDEPPAKKKGKKR